MADRYVRTIGRIEAEENEGALSVGVDYDTVIIGAGARSRRLTASQAENFARLFVSAVWQAGQQSGRMDGESNG